MKAGIFFLILVFLIGIFVYNTGAEKMEEKIIQLPQPKTKGEISLEETISKRRSKRKYIQKELSLEQISQLLWACQGITDKARNFRAAPSAGALYPLEIYLLKKDGFYKYFPNSHQLKLVIAGDLRGELAQAALSQNFIKEAPVNIVITAVYKRVASKYGERGIKYVNIEVGHSAQNVHLEAVALGLDSVPVGAFDDESVSKVLQLPKDHEPIYIIPVGYTGP